MPKARKRRIDGKIYRYVGRSGTRKKAEQRTEFLKHPRGYYNFQRRIIKTKKGYDIFVHKGKK